MSQLIDTGQIANVLRVAFVAGYTTAVRETTKATERLGLAVHDDDMWNWLESILPVEDRERLGQFAATLLLDRFEGDLAAAGLSVGGGA
ncbi:hypothetical protein ABZU32_20325 [Sphaerisporangium sp. NPDC005288]|uniref:hypothetical protein n=1 Tax=Sphaerisporangium sp. NPDC005288 TaxID=3155114 RepID=UPI00339FFFFF